MAKVAVKLFRNLQEAEEAVGKLRAKGYHNEEIGVLTGETVDLSRFAQNGQQAKGVDIPGTGKVNALGPLATALASPGTDSPAQVLAKAMAIPEEALAYYQVGISLGRVLLSVHGEASRVGEAREIMRALTAQAPHVRVVPGSQSPGFSTAGRMTETDPIDAKFSGDFRRY